MKKFNRTAHMTLWLAIADRLRVTGRFEDLLSNMKPAMIKKLGLPGKHASACYACKYTCDNYGWCHCDRCPIGHCHSLYDEIYELSRSWEYGCTEAELERACEIAILIATMPVKEGVLCE